MVIPKELDGAYNMGKQNRRHGKEWDRRPVIIQEPEIPEFTTLDRVIGVGLLIGMCFVIFLTLLLI